MSRGKKGATLIKKVKSTNYEITNAMSVDIHNAIGLKIDGEFKGIKVTDLPIMDLNSTGSAISKKKIEASFVVCELVERKLDEDQVVTKEEVKKEEPKQEIEELTIDNFIDDFKL